MSFPDLYFSTRRNLSRCLEALGQPEGFDLLAREARRHHNQPLEEPGCPWNIAPETEAEWQKLLKGLDDDIQGIEDQINSEPDDETVKDLLR